MMRSGKKGAKDGTQNTNTGYSGVDSVLDNGDGKVWSERKEENQKRLSQKPRNIFQSLKCLTQKSQL